MWSQPRGPLLAKSVDMLVFGFVMLFLFRFVLLLLVGEVVFLFFFFRNLKIVCLFISKEEF